MDDFYKQIIAEAPIGYVYNRIICDEDGIPYDSEFIEMNASFEKIVGLKGVDIIGKRSTVIIPTLKNSKFDWFKACGDIAINGGKIQFEQFSRFFNKWFRVTVSSQQKYFFVIYIIDITKEREQIIELDKLNRQYEIQNNELCWNESFLKLMISTSLLAFLVVDNRTDEILYFNQRFCEIWGITHLEEQMGRGELTNNQIISDCLAMLADIPAFAESCKPLQSQDNRITIEDYIQFVDGRTIRRYSTQMRGENDEYYGRFYIFEDITMQKNIADKLSESEQNFRTFFETIDDIIMVGNAQGELFYTNSAVTKKLGYTQSELKGMHILDIHPLTKRTEAEHIFADMFAKKRSSCPLPLIKKDGSFLAVETRIWFGKWDGKECIFGISKDISIQQAALEKFQYIFENNPNMMAISSLPDRKFIDVNSAFINTIGFSREEIIGKTAKELDLFVEIEKNLKINDMLKNKGKIKDFEIQVRKKDGEIIDGLFSGEVIENQVEKIVLTVMNDITYIKKGKKELQSITTRLELATRAGGVGVWDYDIVNNELFWDEQMFILYGLDKKDFSKTYDAWILGLHPDDVVEMDIETNMAISGEKEFDTEFRVCWPDGTIRNIRALAAVQRDSGGRALRLIGTNWDITAQKQAELEIKDANNRLIEAAHVANNLALEASAANIMKGQFLANMSHEIRTPMNGIMGFLEILGMSKLSTEQQDFVREAKTASEVLLYLINDILDFSKIEAGKLTMEKIKFNIRTAIEDTVSLLSPKASEKNVILHTMIKASVPEEVIGDPSRLRQILNNLISNAVKFTENGEVFVTVDCLEDEDGIALLKFAVKDTGIGIKEENIHKLFQSFNQADASTTRKYGGTGLGLAISKELVKMMAGDIKVESIFGKGSTFSFEVRLEIAKKASKERLIFEQLNGVNVLVVDDNKNNRDIVGTYLVDVGCNVFTAKDAGNGITTIIGKALSKNNIRVAIVDYQMPGLSGYEFAEALQVIPCAVDVKLILLTSASQRGDANEAKERGFAAYLSKPVRRDDLLNCVAAVLGLKKMESENIPIITKYKLNEAKNDLKPRILVVEDNRVNRKIMITMLKNHDLNCDIAADGSEAYQAVLKNDYDIVFMDCQMPVMDGYESTIAIRQAEGSTKHTTIVAMTANAMEGDREKCIAVGMDDYISKPVKFEVMFKLIEDSMKKKC